MSPSFHVKTFELRIEAFHSYVRNSNILKRNDEGINLIGYKNIFFIRIDITGHSLIT